MSPAAPGLLLTDLYQLAMLEAYRSGGMAEEAVFDFYVRDLPPGWGFLVAAGLPLVLETLREARFSDEELAWMADSGLFSAGFVADLARFRFTGSVHAMPEGTLFFPNEPVLRVTAPLPEGQLLETRIINLLQYQIMVASKAVRCVQAAAGRQLVGFGLRRAHGAEAGLLAARSAYLAGFAGSSNVLAAPRFGVPVFGTMAHSFIEAHERESEAFERFARARPEGLVLLIDTYDTEAAARKLLDLAPRLAADGIRIQAVRIDSGDLAEHAARVRRIFDDGGLRKINIFASGALDEHRIAALLAAGAPIDGFGVGTRLDTCADAPALDCAYKLVEYAGTPRRKRSEHKLTWPGPKQVHRRRDPVGRFRGDCIALADEGDDGEPLLVQVMAQGEIIQPQPTLEEARAHLQDQLRQLPTALKALDAEPSYPVAVSAGVRRLAAEADALIARQMA
jgi:nicotinate phosphoribosyltransferase